MSIILRSGRGPYAVSISVAIWVASVYGLIVAVPSDSIDRALPNCLVVLWAAVGLVATTTILLGLYWRNLIYGMLIERIGQILMSAGAAVYLVSISTQSEFDRSGFVMAVSAGLAVASARRAWHITADFHKHWAAQGEDDA